MYGGYRGGARDDSDVWKGIAAGLVGGLIASWTMNKLQEMWGSAEEGGDGENGEPVRKGGREAEAASGSDGRSSEGEEGDDATVKTASALSEGVFKHPLSPREKEIAGPAVHYAFGTAVGGFYGACAELAPVVTRGAGVPFGTVLWIAADEVAVPALGLSKSASAPLSQHASALASHCVYGLTTEIVRRALRSVF